MFFHFLKINKYEIELDIDHINAFINILKDNDIKWLNGSELTYESFIVKYENEDKICIGFNTSEKIGIHYSHYFDKNPRRYTYIGFNKFLNVYLHYIKTKKILLKELL